MLEINHLFDLKLVSDELFNYFETMIAASDYNEEFEYLFGGKLYIIQSISELSEIKGVSNSSLLEAVDQYDIAEYTENEAYAIFVYITNNSGGNTYAIPKDIADQCINVEATIQYRAGE